MSKGINLSIRDLKKDLANCINKSNLPPTVVGYILNDLLIEVNNISNNAINQEYKDYKEELDKKEKQDIAQNKKKGGK